MKPSSSSGLVVASKVVEVGSSSMTTEERKRFKSAAPPRKKGGGENGYSIRNSDYGGRSNDYGGSSLRAALLRIPGGVLPKDNFGQNRGVCFNCQRPGHYAKNCNEPDHRVRKRPKDEDPAK